jgi:hypothetical protein
VNGKTIDKIGTWLVILGLLAVMAYLAVVEGRTEPVPWMLSIVTLLFGRYLPKPGGET